MDKEPLISIELPVSHAITVVVGLHAAAGFEQWPQSRQFIQKRRRNNCRRCVRFIHWMPPPDCARGPDE